MGGHRENVEIQEISVLILDFLRTFGHLEELPTSFEVPFYKKKVCRQDSSNMWFFSGEGMAGCKN